MQIKMPTIDIDNLIVKQVNEMFCTGCNRVYVSKGKLETSTDETDDRLNCYYVKETKMYANIMFSYSYCLSTFMPFRFGLRFQNAIVSSMMTGFAPHTSWINRYLFANFATNVNGQMYYRTQIGEKIKSIWGADFVNVDPVRAADIFTDYMFDWGVGTREYLDYCVSNTKIIFSNAGMVRM